MAEEYSGDFSTNEVESTEIAFGEITENNAGKIEDTLDKIALVADDHEIDAHDEKLSTIPEETESVAGSKADDVEHKEALEINGHQEAAWQDESTEAVTTEDADISISKEPLSSVTEHPTPVSEDLDDSSSDHTTYIEQYRNLMLELTVAKHRNMLLQKKVMEHLKRRKLESISKTEEVTDLDFEMKYLKQLQEFRQLKDEQNAEEQQRDNQLEELKKQKHSLDESIQENLNELVTYINHTAEKLQFGKTASKTSQKEMVERTTGRLVSKLAEFSKLQLEHMKLRNRVAVQQERKRELEVAGEVLNLGNYEQLRTQNQNLVGKVQERDEELQRLGEKAMTSVHNLAHIRQKAWATEEAVQDKSHQLQALEEQLAKMREEMTAMKKQRDYYRTETQRLKQTAGLLMEPALLRDYEQSMEEVTRLSAELQNVRNSYYDDQRKLTNMRKMLQLAKLPEHSSVQYVQISIPCQPNIRQK